MNDKNRLRKKQVIVRLTDEEYLLLNHKSDEGKMRLKHILKSILIFNYYSDKFVSLICKIILTMIKVVGLVISIFIIAFAMEIVISAFVGKVSFMSTLMEQVGL